MVDDTVWQHHMDDEELAEIDAALTTALDLKVNWKEIRKKHFPLNKLAEILKKASEELEEGSGIFRLRGLNLEKYSDLELRTLWMGISSYVGSACYQGHDGELMRRIRNEGGDVGKRHGQIKTNEKGEVFLSSHARTLTSAELRFHTDRTDVVALLCAGQAKTGGNSKLVSSVSVRNAMMERRPDLLELLDAPIWRSRLGEEEGGENMPYPLPVFGYRDGKFTSHYSRTYIEAAQLHEGVPKMSEAQWEAIDMLVELADELSFEMRFVPGDIQFVNNHVIYHSRGAFEDDAASGYVRDLYRLWLTVPNSRSLPQDHEILWRNVEAGLPRGGIALAG
ncbi:MAG: hypothetical protein HOJ34_03820 [Kordiimonadaceae bacterium]|nr:hypothetical protein [Kordiimonadaceae bacterium]MBT6328888.1 hypothetical protein [Kordiimonadaceae bacterium]